MAHLSPDIYFETYQRQPKVRPLEKVRIDTAGFLGIAEKGPVQQLVKITSWKQFQAIFGAQISGSYLAYSVYGYFNNGGEACYVCRIAHTSSPDASKNCSPAQLVLRDLFGRPTILIEASSPGSWGNQLKISITPPRQVAQLALSKGVRAGATSARLESTQGVEPGSILKVSDNTNTEHVRIVKVTRQQVFWDADLPLEHNYSPETGASIEVVSFQLVITHDKGVEIHEELIMSPEHPRYIGAVVNQQSGFVTVKVLPSTTELPYNIPEVIDAFPLTGGRDGLDFVSPEDFIGYRLGPKESSGLGLFDEVDEIGTLCAPDLVKLSQISSAFRSEKDVEIVQRAMVSHCETMRTCFAILDMPQDLDIAQARDYRQKFDSKFAAIYYPWIKVLDPRQENGVISVPPSGHVAGLYSKLDQEVGVHRAPANEILNDAIDLVRDVTKDEQDILNPIGVNVIRYFRGRGIRVWGARTLSSDQLWRYISVRRLFIMIERSLEEGMQWAVFEGNNYTLWKTIERMIGAFLTQLWREGMLKGDSPEEAFFVKCDEETNPPEFRDAGQLLCEIGVAAVRPAEFIIFRIGQRTRDIITEEPVS